jgi:hypothetical protein
MLNPFSRRAKTTVSRMRHPWPILMAGKNPVEIQRLTVRWLTLSRLAVSRAVSSFASFISSSSGCSSSRRPTRAVYDGTPGDVAVDQVGFGESRLKCLRKRQIRRIEIFRSGQRRRTRRIGDACGDGLAVVVYTACMRAFRFEGKLRVIVRWHLELGDEVVARIDADEFSFPFTYGRLVNSPQFERFRQYFTDPNDWPDDDDALEKLCSEVQSHGRFVLRDTSSGIVYEGVCLNHDGTDVVWFRHGGPVEVKN